MKLRVARRIYARYRREQRLTIKRDCSYEIDSVTGAITYYHIPSRQYLNAYRNFLKLPEDLFWIVRDRNKTRRHLTKR